MGFRSTTHSDLAPTIKLGATPVDKRRGQMPVPLNLKNLLTNAQLESVKQMPLFGWRLAFIRRLASGDALAVVVNINRGNYARLESDGSINMEAELHIRDD